MITEYTVIKKFGCAEPNDVFKYESDIDEYCMTASTETDNFFSSRTMCLSKEVVEEYVKNGFLKASAGEETKEECKCNSCHTAEVVKNLKNEIAKLKNQYNQRKETVEKRYAAGKIPTCQKVEHDTVYFNLMKVLDRFEQIVNE